MTTTIAPGPGSGSTITMSVSPPDPVDVILIPELLVLSHSPSLRQYDYHYQ